MARKKVRGSIFIGGLYVGEAEYNMEIGETKEEFRSYPISSITTFEGSIRLSTTKFLAIKALIGSIADN